MDLDLSHLLMHKECVTSNLLRTYFLFLHTHTLGSVWLPCGSGADAVLCGSQLLLAAGGRPVSTQPAGAGGIL